MYLLPRMKLTFPQQIMGFAAAELHEMPLSPSQATNFFCAYGDFSLGGSGCKTLLKSDTTCVLCLEHTGHCCVIIVIWNLEKA